MTSTSIDPVAEAARGLLSSGAVRERARLLLAAARAGTLAHFALREERLDEAARYVADTIRRNYPTLDVPPHARWRHFMVGGEDRFAPLARRLTGDAKARARARFDVAVVSVLLDAGAGAEWRWRDAAGKEFARSEGLALASLDLIERGLVSSDTARPLQADAKGLEGLTVATLAGSFQAGPGNPLVGLEGRTALLNRLGARIAAAPDLFGPERRIGGLYDTLVARAGGQPIHAPDILALLLEALGPIWPGRLTLGGVELGDTWRHPAIDVEGPTRGLMPFHKLSQWLAYSLIEPLQEAGHQVADLDGLTGLAEYRNGGLFVDLGVLVPRNPSLLTTPQQPGDEAIVEWRALTVALLDEIAGRVRAVLGKTAAEMPLASVLEGGTWSAGRRIAAEKRPGGPPPITIVSDGSVF